MSLPVVLLWLVVVTFILKSILLSNLELVFVLAFLMCGAGTMALFADSEFWAFHVIIAQVADDMRHSFSDTKHACAVLKLIHGRASIGIYLHVDATSLEGFIPVSA